MARLTLRQFRASTEETLALLRKSKLGEGFAAWVAKNQEALLNNPRLRPKPGAKQSEAPVREGQSPSQVKKQAGKAEQAEEAAQGMKLKKVKCFKKNDKATAAEYDRQLRDQEKGLNDMTVKEYLEGRGRYTDIGRKGTGKAQEAARARYEKELTDKFKDNLLEQDFDGNIKEEAQRLAKDKMKILAALHNPDMIAGGKDIVKTLGDKGVNSSIGSQWKDRVAELDKAAKEVPESARASTKMNTSLSRCK